MTDNQTTAGAPHLDRMWPGSAASRNGMVRLQLQPAGHPSVDPLTFWMTPGQALGLIAEMSKAAQSALKEQVS